MYSNKFKVCLYLLIMGAVLPLWGSSFNSPEEKGYRAVAVQENQCVAVGTYGRIDFVNTTGEVRSIPNPYTNNLNGVVCEKQTVIAVGDSGVILLSKKGEICRKIESGTTENINCISLFKGLLIAGAAEGTILINEKGRNNWKNIKFPLKGDIVSISADSMSCMGVTNKGEIIKTSNGLNWDIMNYNAIYKGYNKSCIFKSVLLAGNCITIIGQHEDKSPVVLFSTIGNVWTERSLIYNDKNGETHSLSALPNAVCYDALEDCFYLACNDGNIMSLPSCSQCNKIFTVNKTSLRGITSFENRLLVVGDAYFVNSISLK